MNFTPNDYKELKSLNNIPNQNYNINVEMKIQCVDIKKFYHNIEKIAELWENKQPFHYYIHIKTYLRLLKEDPDIFTIPIQVFKRIIFVPFKYANNKIKEIG